MSAFAKKFFNVASLPFSFALPFFRMVSNGSSPSHLDDATAALILPGEVKIFAPTNAVFTHPAMIALEAGRTWARQVIKTRVCVQETIPVKRLCNLKVVDLKRVLEEAELEMTGLKATLERSREFEVSGSVDTELILSALKTGRRSPGREPGHVEGDEGGGPGPFLDGGRQHQCAEGGEPGPVAYADRGKPGPLADAEGGEKPGDTSCALQNGNQAFSEKMDHVKRDEFTIGLSETTRKSNRCLLNETRTSNKRFLSEARNCEDLRSRKSKLSAWITGYAMVISQPK
ncbi:unnamed protein product [Acanthoscelides obtectus]|uniref:Uncharacterized protein n=1 Tax=Acanthoscelides obtectus TaxID=200917 RepID=A0A9P0M0N1_ACAOB|nr:unnamed protein product [Acanthoscelides obtectus]CAK1668404.1 hypothetical protein AOBTE_LOCUS26375 [Acanthoscelides obtectus]